MTEGDNQTVDVSLTILSVPPGGLEGILEFTVGVFASDASRFSFLNMPIVLRNTH